MQPYVPIELLPWVDFGDDTVKLKDGAPAEVIPMYEKLKAYMDKEKERFVWKD